jgi:hypothetical protein
MLVAFTLTTERGAETRSELVPLSVAARGVRVPTRAAVAVFAARVVLSWACVVHIRPCSAGSTAHARFGEYTLVASVRRGRAYLAVLAPPSPPRGLACELTRCPRLRARALASIGVLAARVRPLPKDIWIRIAHFVTQAS